MESRVFSAAATAVGVLGCLSAVWPQVGVVISLVLAGLVLAVLGVCLMKWPLRRRRISNAVISTPACKQAITPVRRPARLAAATAAAGCDWPSTAEQRDAA